MAAKRTRSLVNVPLCCTFACKLTKASRTICALNGITQMMLPNIMCPQSFVIQEWTCPTLGTHKWSRTSLSGGEKGTGSCQVRRATMEGSTSCKPWNKTCRKREAKGVGCPVPKSMAGFKAGQREQQVPV